MTLSKISCLFARLLEAWLAQPWENSGRLALNPLARCQIRYGNRKRQIGECLQKRRRPGRNAVSGRRIDGLSGRVATDVNSQRKGRLDRTGFVH